MVDGTHAMFKSSIREVALWESIIRCSDPTLALEKRNGNKPLFSKWVLDNDEVNSSFMTRVYKTNILVKDITIEARIKFIYDRRESVGKVVISMPNEFRGILKPIPNPSMGLSELFVGERMSTTCSVCKVPEGGLGVNIICPFCHGVEEHRCKEKE